MWIFILLPTILLRFFNYGNRVTLGQDQARDAIIGLLSLQDRVLPLVGPPSSAGQFSFGPIYYWIISAFSFFFPFTFGPWVGFTILSVISVMILWKIGVILGGNIFGLFLGFVASFASSSIFHSVDMLNPILVPFFTIFALFSLVKLVEQKRLIYSLFLGFFVGAAISAHLQALTLLTIIILVPIVNDFSKRRKLFVFGLECTGLFVATLPFIYNNFQIGFSQAINIASYLTTGQSQIGAGNSPIKDLGYFWPRLFGEVLTFTPIHGYLILAIVAFAIFLAWRKKIGIQKSTLIVLIAFVAQGFFLNLYGGIRTPVYLLVFHPFIILITAWAFWIIFRFRRALGVILILIFILTASFSNIRIIQGQTQKPYIESLKKILDEKTRDFVSIYESGEAKTVSYPLVYLYFMEGRLTEGGYRLGICQNKFLNNKQLVCPVEVTPFRRIDADFLYDLNVIDKERINQIGFETLTPRKIYLDTLID